MKLILAVPVPSNPMIDIRCAAWCAALNNHPLVTWKWAQGMDCDEGRNMMIARALEDPDMTHMFFLDSDTVPPADAVQQLMDLNMPVVCGVTPILQKDRLYWNVRTPEDDGWWPKERPLPGWATETSAVGGTTILVTRRVLESIQYPWFRRQSQEPVHNEPCFMSGDVWFCERIRKAGFAIMFSPFVRCHHYKTLDLLALMEGRTLETAPEPFDGAGRLRPPTAPPARRPVQYELCGPGGPG